MADERSGDLVARWQQGDQQAAEELFRRYADRLIGLARTRLPRQLNGRVDAEDVVQSVYRSFFAAAREGRYDLRRGGDLWRLLVAITLHKLSLQVRDHGRGKRSVQQEQRFGSEDSLVGLQAHMMTHEPSLEEAVALADELQEWMGRLEPLPRRALELRLQGYKLDEIANEMDCSERTVMRMLEQVKQRLDDWQKRNV